MMAGMLYRPDRPIPEIINGKDFTFSVELVPPRNGESIEGLFKKVKMLSEAGVDMISITKGAGGSLRGGTTPIAFIIKEKFKIPVIAHFTCMEASKQEIENNLVDHAYLGITNVLALRGDPPTGVFSEYVAAPDQHQFAYQLIEQIQGLLEGHYLKRQGFDKESTSFHLGEAHAFCIGAAAYPEPLDITLDQSVDYFVTKVRQGATYGITQMTYSPENYQIFMNKLKEKNAWVPILPGVRILGGLKQVDFLEKMFHIKIPSEYVAALKTGKDELNKTYIKDLVLKFRAHGAKGIQFFVINEAELLAEIIAEMK
jgi:methylenetetrahydrofolate reductase (NADPH)